MKRKQIFWLVLKMGDHGAEEILGLYDTEKEAVKRCKTWQDIVGPLELNDKLPDKAKTWPNAYYPITRTLGIKPLKSLKSRK
jgi:hypothetical protein